MRDQFKHRTAVVTGAGSGIGAATVLELVRRGAAVVAVDLNERGLYSLAGEAAAIAPGKVTVMTGDISQEATCKAMVKLAVDRYESLHLAVNNAGIGAIGPQLLHEANDESWRRPMDVNFGGVVYGMRYQLAQMMAAGSGGAIVNVASVYAQLGMRQMETYPASKHAVLGYSRSAALEYADKGIRINVVSPGVIETGLTAAADKDRMAKYAAKSPLRRMGRPDELAKAICFLLSDDASFVVGANLLVDGGYVLT